MTPLEINQKIAEIKGYEYTAGKVSMGDGMGIFINWAEDIADAFNLFDEMPGGVLSKDETEDGKDIYHCHIRGTDSPEWAHSPSMAICFKFIEWKKNQVETR